MLEFSSEQLHLAEEELIKAMQPTTHWSVSDQYRQYIHGECTAQRVSMVSRTVPGLLRVSSSMPHSLAAFPAGLTDRGNQQIRLMEARQRVFDLRVADGLRPTLIIADNVLDEYRQYPNSDDLVAEQRTRFNDALQAGWQIRTLSARRMRDFPANWLYSAVFIDMDVATTPEPKEGLVSSSGAYVELRVSNPLTIPHENSTMERVHVDAQRSIHAMLGRVATPLTSASERFLR